MGLGSYFLSVAWSPETNGRSLSEFGPEGFCPRCLAPLESREDCASCGLAFGRFGGVVDVIGRDEREDRAAEVERFYTKSPFPGYAPSDDGPALLDRCRRAPYIASLDATFPTEGDILDCGCGTAQIPAFLALAAPRRRVIAVDGCRESLAHADEFRARAGIHNLQLVRGDLFDLPVEKRRFSVVHSRGVVHHTPDPDRAIECVADCVAPGGFLVLGWYETRGRAFHRTRRALGRVAGRPLTWLDPVLRRRDLDAEKKRIWIEDQYLHPLEHILGLPRVVRVLERCGFRWVRTVPPAAPGTTLLEPTPQPTPLGMSMLRLGWMLRGVSDPDAGLVCLVAQRQA